MAKDSSRPRPSRHHRSRRRSSRSSSRTARRRTILWGCLLVLIVGLIAANRWADWPAPRWAEIPVTQWPEAAAAWWSRVSRGQEPTKSWHRVWVSPEAKIELPADDAPHTMRAERWRYSGHLKSDTGEGFTFHYTVTMRNATKTRSAIQVAFTDQQTGRHYTAQRRTEDDPSKDIKDGFHFQFGNWVMTRAAGNERLFVDTPEFSFELSLQQGAEPMMHGGTGLIQLETAGSSYYYARPDRKSVV